MSQHRNHTNGTTNKQAPSAPAGATWTSREAYLLACVCLLFGLVLGYLFRGSSGVTTTGAVSTPAPPSTPPSSMPGGQVTAPVSPEALEPLAAPMIAAAKANPTNAEAWTQLGNLYFDHKSYEKAIEYYGKSLELRPDDPNVRTDLGTAHWYSGNAKQAVLEYEKSLKVDPGHINTLMNMGIVRLNGLNDAKGAIASWEKLLKLHPEFQEKQRVLNLIAEARAK